MCGRSRCTVGRAAVERAAGTSRWVAQEQYTPTYNCSPGQATPVVRMSGDGEPADGEPVVHVMRWGLVPSFTKPDERPDFWRMFNARSESAAEKPSFRRLVPTRRCLVLCEGFYEWLKEKGKKQPYYIHLAPKLGHSSGSNAAAAAAAASAAEADHAAKEEDAAAAGAAVEGSQAEEEEPLVFAGLYDVWQGAEGPMHTYTILTTDSSKRLQWLHDRMPVILRTREEQQAWLRPRDKAELGKLMHLCKPYNGEDLVWRPVTPQMSVPSFQGPECVKELQKPKVQDFFKPRKAGAPASPAAAAQAASPAGDGQQQAQHQEQKQQSPKADPDAAKPEPDSQAAVNADEQPADRQQAGATMAEGAQAAAETPQREQAPASGAASPAPAGQKRKQPEASGGGGKKAPGLAGKKAKPPPGTRDIRAFFGGGGKKG